MPPGSAGEALQGGKGRAEVAVFLEEENLSGQ